MTGHLAATLAKQILRRSVWNASKPASRSLDVPKAPTRFLKCGIGSKRKGHCHRLHMLFTRPCLARICFYCFFFCFSGDPLGHSFMIVSKNCLGIMCTNKNNTDHTMAILLKGIMTAKQILRRSNLLANQATEVPKGFFAVYVGESQKKRFTVPISFLNQPSFQELLRIAEEEFGYNHPMGGLTLPCREDTFIDIISGLNLS
ncbi:hypothetical protein NC653_011720 [Populus alba x Populus x berolinensis]|uniref:Uncharacterized protein n=2 Tax=Populus TaxID=3689 RepID=A0AAD6R323_9ROSI|nr:hypothetical protein NC653_011720 [Populus alba x Populus x berolinensis]